ncbi:hypothetical protein HNY73_011716, partial [Argiope bruennichi]
GNLDSKGQEVPGQQGPGGQGLRTGAAAAARTRGENGPELDQGQVEPDNKDPEPRPGGRSKRDLGEKGHTDQEHAASSSSRRIWTRSRTTRDRNQGPKEVVPKQGPGGKGDLMAPSAAAEQQAAGGYGPELDKQGPGSTRTRKWWKTRPWGFQGLMDQVPPAAEAAAGGMDQDWTTRTSSQAPVASAAASRLSSPQASARVSSAVSTLVSSGSYESCRTL